ncbi:SAM and PH domain protein [Aspergillus terreus]|uniref:SAM and PH domain protein n=1 Tax=Aspergillus terreus TaxID=33178 RepID=A0A5M3YYN7_ASPTE|nr:hypothetical protein ATETN484_0006012400 [Aspergillus terreus]GFF19865.1 SAM and PH domain protein [Aspergillus terreus]
MTDDDNDNSSGFPEDSPFTSVASFGTGSSSTASTPNEATTPDSTGLTAFDFHIDEKIIRGPNGPHLFRSSTDSSEYPEYIDEAGFYFPDQIPSATVPYHLSASKLDPVRRDTPVPNQPASTSQTHSHHSDSRGPASSPGVFAWSPREVVQWLQSQGFDDGVVETFFINDITGSILLELQAQDLKELGIQSFGKRHMLMSSIQGLRDAIANSRLVRRPSESASIPDPLPTARSCTTMSSDSASEGSKAGRRSSDSRRRRRQDSNPPRKITDLAPGDSVSIVAIEQMLPKIHSCSKGENCRKWQKQQAKLAQLARDLPAGSLQGRIILTGDPGNPKTAPNLVRSPKSDITPSLIASSDVLGPRTPGFQLSKEKLNEVQPRDPQENVRNFLSFQNLSKLQPVNEPGTPPKEVLPSPESSSPSSIRGNQTLSEHLRHLPKLQIPSNSKDSVDLTSSVSAQRTAIPSMMRKQPYEDDGYETATAIPQGQKYAYGTTMSPGDFYRTDPHYGQSTPLSEMDVPMTAFPIGPVAREESQSVPPNMRFGTNRFVAIEPITRPASTKTENHRRNTSQQNFPTLGSLDERCAVNPIETPDDMAKTPRVGYAKGLLSPTRRTPNDITHSGWMKKRKTTRLLRHEWEDHHFTLQGTQLAMHTDEESARRNSKALEYIDVDDYAVACSSLASSSKLTAAFKKTVLKRKDNPLNESAFGFSLIPGTGHGNSIVDRKALLLNSGKSHHFAVKTRDERIDWMRELMLAKALKRGRDSGASLNVNGNMI